MKLACAFLLIAVFAPGGLMGQAPVPDPGSSNAMSHAAHAVVAGIVTKEPGSEPVKKAIIELIAESQNQGQGGNYTALTAPDGSFRIENIEPGRYRFFVERSGYQEMSRRHPRTDGRLLTLAAGQEIKDLIIRLQAAAVVAGRVTDEDGDPMPEAQVAVLRRTYIAGRSHWEQVGAQRTNDLGEYRVPGLAAGSYFVSVTPPPDFRSLIEATRNAPSDEKRNIAAASEKVATAYQTTYYPGTHDRAQAEAIQLRGGDEFPVNFSLMPSPSLTIRGSVVNLPAGATAAIMLQSKDFSLVLNGAEMRKDGSFEVRDVSPGSYNILATVDNSATPMMARQAVQVTSTNVDGLRLAPQSGGTIRGRIRMEGNVRVDPSQMFLMLRSADGDDDILGAFESGSGFSSVAHVNADGSFEWKNVLPGHYSVQISEASAMPDWFLKSATTGGRDVVESGFSVGGGMVTLDLLASANGATAEGVALNPKGEPVSDAVVVAVPEARLRSHPEHYREAVTDQSGRFTLRGIPPGAYTFFAWESVEGEAYLNPEFLKSYEGQGRPLHLNEGERKSVQLNVIAEPGETSN